MNTTISLQPFQLTRPEKVEWLFTHPENIELGIKSKSLRAFGRQIEQVFAENQIRWEYKELTEQEYLNWLPYYREKIAELQYDLFADEEWYHQKVTEGFTVAGLFCYQAEKMIGSMILTRKGDDVAVGNFKVTERLDLSKHENSSLGAAVEYLFVQLMSQQNVKQISSGRSRNAFGVINSVGYLDYKLRFGFEPTLVPGVPFLTEVPVNEQGTVLFYGVKDQELALYALTPHGSTQKFEPARFASDKIPFVTLQY